ncbi:MAG: nicotinamide N-methylase [Rhodospirillales bacterium]|nr:nicotinamide N-methylase [Rhodospirillales bacterium]
MTDRYTRFVRENTVPTRAPLVPELTLHLASEVTPLWHATEEVLAQQGLPPPYWAFAWPGGQAFARLLLDRPEVAYGRNVLDFAAGCGIAAIAAVKSGASRVTASEIDAFATAAIGLNTALNNVSVDVIDTDMLGAPPAAWDLILAGDVCYEKPMADRVLPWLDHAVARGAEVLIADPGRAYLPASGLTEIASYDVPTSLDLENRKIMTTVIYRYARSKA